MEAHVTSQSQSYRLRQRAEEAQIRHGQEVRADVPNVRVTASAGASFSWLRRGAAAGHKHGDVYFCNIGRIRVREVLAEGDDTPLPNEVVVEGLEIAEPGSYDLVNVLIRSNGDIRLVMDEQTRIEPAARPSGVAYF
ncbi:MAG: hypothetical protein IRY91_09210 [Gemmatimonadaceae bacterium]|nr:hypothetical protein [Gemmatimonadaceae bacterium]